jgi:hypothetical protein
MEMPTAGSMENEGSGLPQDMQGDLLRLFNEAVKRERKHTEKRLNGLFQAVTAEMNFMERRISAKLDEIDASLNVIAQELERRTDDPAANKGNRGH